MTTVPTMTIPTPVQGGNAVGNSITTPPAPPAPPTPTASTPAPQLVKKHTIGFVTGKTHVYKGKPGSQHQPEIHYEDDGSVRVIITEMAEIMFFPGMIAWIQSEDVLDDGTTENSDPAAVVTAGTSDSSSGSPSEPVGGSTPA